MADSINNQFIDRLKVLNQKNDHCGKIFDSIEISENTLLNDCWNLGELFTDLKSQLAASCASAIGDVTERRQKIKNIQEILSNEEIQIVFIGSVSSGKSKVINAIIEEEIFQSSTGATTTHIVKLTTSGDDTRSLILGTNEPLYFDKRDDLIEKILELSTTLGDHPIGNDDLLDISLSKPKGKILDERIKLIDTPGCDSSVKAKSRILEMCQVSDIVVFVMTYNFNEAERAMFESLSKKTSKLNMYILVNKWDESDMDKTDSTEKSKKTIENNLIKWLTKSNELDQESAKAKFFFISAKERMEIVTNEIRDVASADREDNVKFRHEQFEKFIHELKGNIDHPEFTKCKKHEKDIEKMEEKLNGDIQQCLKLTNEIIGKRKTSIDKMESIRRNLQVNKSTLLSTLLLEKNKKLELLMNLQKPTGWFNYKSYFPKKNLNKEDLLQLDELVSKFDNELNELENVEEVNVKQIGIYAISNESNDVQIKTHTTILTEVKDSEQLPQPDKDQIKGNVNMKKKQSSSKHKKNDKKKETDSANSENSTRESTTNVFENEKKKETDSANSENSTKESTTNVFENEIISTFQDFQETVCRRLDTILKTTEMFLENIKLSCDELESIYDKANY